MTATIRTAPGYPTWARSGGVDVLTVSGDLDVATVPRLRAALAEADRSRPVVLDLSDVTFIDSSGLGALINARKQLPGQGQLVLAGCSPQMLRLLRVTGLHTVFTVTPTLAEALVRP